jgi:dipeptidyl aminopeptidase/acylaminoacyl peptidase
MMKKTIFLFCALLAWSAAAIAQPAMTPELLWQLGRVSAKGLSADGQHVIYSVSTPVAEENRFESKTYRIPLRGGEPEEIADASAYLPDKRRSPDGRHEISIQKVKINPVTGPDFYPELGQSSALIYESLHYRHWDSWMDGTFSHLFVHPVSDDKAGEGRDIMAGEPYDSPQRPFGGEGDFCWSPDSKRILYVSKKKFGTDYALSTNTDLYAYDLASGATENLTAGMAGYDTYPSFSSQGVLAWLSMARDGYESDKNDLYALSPAGPLNLTAQWDGTVRSYRWAPDGQRLYFNAPIDGTIQLFEVDYPGLTKKLPTVRQITRGDFDISALVGQSGELMVVTRTDMNQAAELFTVNLSTGEMQQLTQVNTPLYGQLGKSRVERRYLPTTDGQQMLAWVIYPPDFDPAKKYPTLLYCQGGPQSPLSQFYSFRWNFQLMAAQGYIVVAPNRRGMPGHGTAWNEQISTDYGGQVMQDYLTAIDALAQEPYVDEERLGCVGASFGGYSVFFLAGIHEGRFKTFISHAGLFNLKSMYGTTEELFFVNWDLGGPYWETDNAAAMRSYAEFDPSQLVAQWDTPIFIIQGGKDYRVPKSQAFEAFQTAQLRGIKSRLLLIPDENHWILQPHNALVWQREFFKWLRETL